MGVPRKKLRSRILFIADVLLLLLVQILQGSALNYFFIKQYEEYFTSYFLFILDFFCLCIFTGTFVLSYNHFNQKNHEERGKSFLSAVNKRWPDLKLGILPMCYVSWFLYSSILITKLTVIFLRLNSYEHNHTQVLQVRVIQLLKATYLNFETFKKEIDFFLQLFQWNLCDGLKYNKLALENTV